MKRTEYPRRDFLKKSSVLAAGWVAGAGKTFKLGEPLRSAQTTPLKKLMERVRLLPI
ncbi:twin-arginine translocation signal domain-containing protein [Niabella sp. W65]|nr:twin-arginine translocation signal domain-containing protein [Niabella sp. W65]MCH7366536.1 twin-arginine translocation signal domain-containing protein [Niabella sp. W65]